MNSLGTRMVLAAVGAGILLLPIRADAQVRLEKPEPNRYEIVSDGPPRWTLPFYVALSPRAELVPVSPDRTLFFIGSVLHLIDTKNGVVTGRWIFPQPIDSVEVDGSRFLVRSSSPDSAGTPQTTAIDPNSPPPAFWMNQALLLYRIANYEGASFDARANFKERIQKAPAAGVEPRQPLTREEAEKLIVELEEAARRNPFQPRFGVVLALLMKDAGRNDADSVFRQAINRPTNFFGELFAIANDLENVGEEQWATVAFEQGYALLWKQGLDPRLVYSILPRLIFLYLPYDLRVEIPVERRARLSDRVYRLGPYVEGSPAAWSILASYFRDQGAADTAALWTDRSAEATRKSGFVWEPAFHLERTIRALAALSLCIILYYLVLQRRYAPHRRLLRKAGGSPWWRLDRRLSIACWDRHDRQVLLSLVLLCWLCAGLFGGIGQSVVRSEASPFFGGTLRPPAMQTFLESLPPSSERSFLIALSRQQAEQAQDAESLYRTLPNSAEAWNNLGVLQVREGKAREAAQSFENAIRLNPELEEAAFNLDRPVRTAWSEMHRQYRPEQKMLALPSHDTMYRAIRGPLSRLAGDMLMGPVSGLRAAGALIRQDAERATSYGIQLPLAERLLSRFGPSALYLFLAFALALVWASLRAPYDEVTQPPGPWHWLLELLLPGTARDWRAWGGLVLSATLYAILEVLSRNVFLSGFDPISGRAFGLPPATMEAFGGRGTPTWPTDPGWLWTSGPAILVVLLFVLNAALVLRSRRRANSAL